MIRVRGLEKHFRQVVALDGVDMEVHPGRVAGVLGPNASGKTTLLKCILGLVVPDKGELSVCGTPADREGHQRRFIGYLPQQARFPVNLTGNEIFAMAEDICQLQGSRRAEMIDRFEIGSFLSRPLGGLSGGARQRIAAVLAFMFDRPVLILDEPSVGLDPRAASALKKLIAEEAARGKTILIVSHILSEAEQLLSEVFFMLDGKVLFSGTVESLIRESNAQSFEEAVLLRIPAPGAAPTGRDLVGMPGEKRANAGE